MKAYLSILLVIISGLTINGYSQTTLSIFDLRNDMNLPTQLFDSISTYNLSDNELINIQGLTESYIKQFNAEQQLNQNKLKQIGEYHLQYLPNVNKDGIENLWINCIHKSQSKNSPEELYIVADGLNFYNFNFTIPKHKFKLK